MAETVALSLISHTNAGKTALARTLLGRDVGEVRDAPHVTAIAERHAMIETAQGDVLYLWDTPGFGDSARLARRLAGLDHPIVALSRDGMGPLARPRVLVEPAGGAQRARRGRCRAVSRQRVRVAGRRRLHRAGAADPRVDRQAGHRAAEPDRTAARSRRRSGRGRALARCARRGVRTSAACCRSMRSRAAGCRRACCCGSGAGAARGEAGRRSRGSPPRGMPSAQRSSTSAMAAIAETDRACRVRSARRCRTRDCAARCSMSARRSALRAIASIAREAGGDAHARPSGSTPTFAPSTDRLIAIHHLERSRGRRRDGAARRRTSRPTPRSTNARRR